MESFSEIIKSDRPTLVDFYATWCGPCKAMIPVMDQLKNKMGDKVRILKIDVDKNQPLSTKMQVRGVPTFVLYKSGKVVWRQSGAIPLNNLEDLIHQHS